MRRNRLLRLTLSGMLLAAALLLPLLTGQIKTFGNALCPMHFPVLLCGFFCGPWYGAAVGLIAPLLRFFLFGMPVLFPSGVGMCVELATYGAVAGILCRVLPKKPGMIFVSLIGAMIAGRLTWGLARVILWGVWDAPFGWAAFFAGAVTNAVPGMILQIVLIPPLVLLVRKYFPLTGNQI